MRENPSPPISEPSGYRKDIFSGARYAPKFTLLWLIDSNRDTIVLSILAVRKIERRSRVVLAHNVLQFAEKMISRRDASELREIYCLAMGATNDVSSQITRTGASLMQQMLTITSVHRVQSVAPFR